jgi:hypothetical protein
MSVSLYWRPREPLGTHFGGTSSTLAKLEEQFGKQPIVLTSENIKTLEGMAMYEESLSEVVEALYKYDEVVIEANY